MEYAHNEAAPVGWGLPSHVDEFLNDINAVVRGVLSPNRRKWPEIVREQQRRSAWAIHALAEIGEVPGQGGQECQEAVQRALTAQRGLAWLIDAVSLLRVAATGEGVTHEPWVRGAVTFADKTLVYSRMRPFPWTARSPAQWAALLSIRNRHLQSAGVEEELPTTLPEAGSQIDPEFVVRALHAAVAGTITVAYSAAAPGWWLRDQSAGPLDEWWLGSAYYGAYFLNQTEALLTQ